LVEDPSAASAGSATAIRRAAIENAAGNLRKAFMKWFKLIGFDCG
jgi:hypothetical protein